MTDHVRCSRCGKRVSNEVPGELIVRAFVECPECIKAREENLMIEHQRQRVVTLHVTGEEIDALAVALARSVYPDSTATDALTASAEVWQHGPGGLAGPLATMLAEARP